MRSLYIVVVLTAGLTALSGSALAGPPFATDDPITLPYHTGETYLFSSGSRAVDGTSLDAAPGIEINYCLMPNTFFHLVAPLSLNRPNDSPSAYGPGDMEVGFKYQFLQQSHDLVDVAIFPLVEIPTGDKQRGLGTGEWQLFLPVWLEKDSGPWTVYGGGGYYVNPGSGNCNWWFTGLLVQHQIGDLGYLGAEMYHQTADVVDGATQTGYNLGGGITITGTYQVLFSAGRNLQDIPDNQFSYYAALYTTFR